jgi:hypothetical protein
MVWKGCQGCHDAIHCQHVGPVGTMNRRYGSEPTGELSVSEQHPEVGVREQLHSTTMSSKSSWRGVRERRPSGGGDDDDGGGRLQVPHNRHSFLLGTTPETEHRPHLNYTKSSQDIVLIYTRTLNLSGSPCKYTAKVLLLRPFLLSSISLQLCPLVPLLLDPTLDSVTYE